MLGTLLDASHTLTNSLNPQMSQEVIYSPLQMRKKFFSKERGKCFSPDEKDLDEEVVETGMFPW